MPGTTPSRGPTHSPLPCQLSILEGHSHGIDKTWLACALAQQAGRQGDTARYLRLPRLLQDLALARADGRYPRLLRESAKTHPLIIDDGGLTPLTSEGRRDLLEILDDRHQRHSTGVTSQLPGAAWQEYLHEPTLADALLDRLGPNAYTRNLSGASMRRRKKPLTTTLTEQYYDKTGVAALRRVAAFTERPGRHRLKPAAGFV